MRTLPCWQGILLFLRLQHCHHHFNSYNQVLPYYTVRLSAFLVDFTLSSCSYSTKCLVFLQRIEDLFHHFSLCRFYYLRGFINTLYGRRLEALGDFQNLYRTDTAIFPTQLVTWLVDSLHRDERQQADRRPELKRLILKVNFKHITLDHIIPIL